MSRFSPEPNLVLRTVYLSRDLDEWLRSAAYAEKVSKNEIIRRTLQEVRASGSLRGTTLPEVPFALTHELAFRFLQAFPIWMQVFDEKMEQVLWCNKACERLFERSLAEIRGTSRSKLVANPKRDIGLSGPTGFHILTPEGETKTAPGLPVTFSFTSAIDSVTRVGDLTFDEEILEQQEKQDRKGHGGLIHLRAAETTIVEEEGQEYIRSFVENVPAVALIKDAEGRVLWSNRFFDALVERLTGKTSDTFQKTTAEIFSLPLEAQRSIEACERLVTEKRIAVVGSDNIKNERRVVVRFPILSTDGSSVEYIGVVSTPGDVGIRSKSVQMIQTSDRR